MFSSTYFVRNSKYKDQFSKGWLKLFYILDIYDENLDNWFTRVHEEIDIKKYCLGLLD